VLNEYFRPNIERLVIAAERSLAKKSDVLIAVSEEVRCDLLERGVGEPEQFRVIPLGLDLAHLLEAREPGRLRQSLGLGFEVPLVGLVGRLTPIKDVPTVLHAIHRIPDVHLAVLGDGEERATLENLVESLGISDRVHFLGWWLDVATAFVDLDVVVLSSRNEGTPVALIEAAAAGRPVVATRVGGVASVVADGETGYLVPPSDPVAFAEKLEDLLRDAPLRSRMGHNARVNVAPRYSAQRLIEDIRSLYDELTH
jgi:glycosyltransferase involved in cell wall biosynthesis